MNIKDLCGCSLYQSKKYNKELVSVIMGPTGKELDLQNQRPLRV